MSAAIVKSMLSGGTALGTALAAEFGLNAKYFSQVMGRESLNRDIKVFEFKNTTLVEIPPEARRYILDDAYVAVPITDGDESEYDYVLPITSRMKIGFWRG